MKYLKILLSIVLISMLVFGSTMSAYAVDMYHLAVSVEPGSVDYGFVSVVSGESGFQNWNSGSVFIAFTDDVTVTANAIPGYHFVRWEVNFGDGFVDAPYDTYEFTCNLSHCGDYVANVALRAYFAPNQESYDVSVVVEDETGWGTVTGAGTYDVGELVTLTASPSTHFSFYDWSGPDSVDPNFDGVVLTFIMPDEPVEITAYFNEEFNVMATIQYVNASDVAIATGTVQKVYAGAYSLTPPAITGYTFSSSSTNATGMITGESADFTVIHRYVAIPEPTTQPTTEPSTIVYNIFDFVTPVTTVPTTETITEENVPLAGPNPDSQPLLGPNPEVNVPLLGPNPDAAPMPMPIPTTEVPGDVILDEEVPLADALPQTGQLSMDYLYGIGGMISGLGLWLKRRK